jgi:tRNA modification GTPase
MLEEIIKNIISKGTNINSGSSASDNSDNYIVTR